MSTSFITEMSLSAVCHYLDQLSLLPSATVSAFGLSSTKW